MRLPDWVPLESWNGWVDMRKRIKKPLTDRAVKMAVKKLKLFKDQGFDVEAILEQSEFNCWQDLYPVKGNERSQSNNRVSSGTSRADQARAEIDRLFGEDEPVEAGHAEASQLRLVK